MSVVIGLVNRTGEKQFVDTFIDGADDMVGVILIIAIARGASVLMQTTHLDNYIIFNAAEALKNVGKTATSSKTKKAIMTALAYEGIKNIGNSLIKKVFAGDEKPIGDDYGTN
jgi:uncharacterized ion transporter superfamily protein YfcC